MSRTTPNLARNAPIPDDRGPELAQEALPARLGMDGLVVAKVGLELRPGRELAHALIVATEEPDDQVPSCVRQRESRPSRRASSTSERRVLMTKGFLRFLRRNTIALLALFLALGGTTYAASTALGPRNSVASPQVVNGSLQTKDLSAKARKALKGNRGLRGRCCRRSRCQGRDGRARRPGRPGCCGNSGHQAVRLGRRRLREPRSWQRRNQC